MLEKIVLVTRRTRLQELIARFNTRGQARFYIEHSGGDFAEYEDEDRVYRGALEEVRRSLAGLLRVQVVERFDVATFLFAPTDVVVTLGPDGLVANVAKYVQEQPIVAVNPDPVRIDGILLPYRPDQVRAAITGLIQGRARDRRVRMARAELNDGRSLTAFNDLFVGVRSHVSARYRLRWQSVEEPQSSSGVIVSTGAGSTGWLSSVFTMTSGLASFAGGGPIRPMTLGWDDPRLVFVVREPFVSRHSRASAVAGLIEEGSPLEIESLMPTGGVIFSDGIESDFLEFNSGAVARIGAAPGAVRLCTP